MVKRFKKNFILVLVFIPIIAFSHDIPAPFLLCKKDNINIVCVGGYSNGSHAKGNKISLINLETKEVLERKVFDRKSKVVFENIPKDNFYILMNIGNGTNSIEVSKNQILDWTNAEKP